MSVTAERPRAAAPPARQSRTGFDAFVSYSHAADGRLAPAVEQGLRTMAKPWYRRRALRVFRDRTSLSASPQLWGSIEAALRTSRTFLLLAAPESATSEWVDHEVGWWREHRDSQHCLIAVTGGELRWDRDKGDFTDESAVPPSMHSWFNTEPLWVDLRWARTEEDLSLRNPRFRDAIAELAAPLHGLPKDELVGEDVRQHRRAMRLARSAVLLLVGLTAVAAVAAVVALSQRNEARDQRDLATARQVAATASGLLESRLDVANALAAEGYSRRVTPQTEAALFAAVSASPHLVRFAAHETRVTALVPGAAESGQVLIGDAAGRVRAWSPASGRLGPVLLDAPASVTTISLSESGRVVAAADEGGLVLVRDVREPDVREIAAQGRVEDVALDRRGRVLAVGRSARKISLSVYNAQTGALVRSVDPGGAASKLRFARDGRTLLVSWGFGAWRRFSLPTLTRVGAEREPIVLPDHEFYSARSFYFEVHSADRRYYGYVDRRGLHAYATPAEREPLAFPLPAGTEPTAAAIAPNAARTAIAAGGGISLLGSKDFRPGGRLVADPFTGVGADVTALAFTPDARLVVSAAGNLLAAWDPAQRSRLARAYPVDLTGPLVDRYRPAIVLSGDGRQVATGDVLGDISLSDVQRAEWAGNVDFESFAGNSRPELGLILDQRARRVTAVDDRDTVAEVDVRSGRRLRSLHVPARDPTASVHALLPSTDGRPLVLFTDGSVAVADLARRRVERVAGAVPGEHVVAGHALAGSTLYVLTYQNALLSLDLRTGRRTPWPLPRGETTTSVAASTDGRTLATASRAAGGVTIWDVPSRRIVRRLDTGAVVSVAMDGGATRLVAVLASDALSVWSPRAGIRLGDLPLADPQVQRSTRTFAPYTTATFGPDGTLWTATLDLGLYAWSMSPARWLRMACETAGRALSREEWQRYLGIPYSPHERCHL